MSKKKTKNSLKELKRLDASSFLKKYYGISHKSITNMTHQTMSRFFPQLERTSFEHVQKNPELISTGRIIMVEDVKHLLAPYFTPDSIQKDDYLLGTLCDKREQVIATIVDTFEKIIENNLEALLVIECSKDLTPYLYMTQNITEGITTLFTNFVSSKRGLVMKKDYSLVSYQIFNHGDNSYTTMMLPPLESQAVGISNRTDAISIFYEDGKLCFTYAGEKILLEDTMDLRKQLFIFFPEEVQDEQDLSTCESVKPDDLSDYDISNMSVYELEQLMKVYKASNQMPYYHIVRRALVKKTKKIKDFRRKKDEETIKVKILEGDDYNDQY